MHILLFVALPHYMAAFGLSYYGHNFDYICAAKPQSQAQKHEIYDIEMTPDMGHMTMHVHLSPAVLNALPTKFFDNNPKIQAIGRGVKQSYGYSPVSTKEQRLEAV